MLGNIMEARYIETRLPFKLNADHPRVYLGTFVDDLDLGP